MKFSRKNWFRKLSPSYAELLKVSAKLDVLLDILDPDQFHRSGERQVATSLDRIRPDHLGRYRFAAAQISPGERVLDMACGIGYGSYLLAKESPADSIVAVDIEPQAIDYGRLHYHDERISFVCGDALDVALPADLFDTVVSFETIEHLPQPERLLQRFQALLRPGGRLICSTPNQAVMPFNKANFPFHLRHFTESQMREMLGAAGFQVDEVHSQYEKKSESFVQDGNGKYLIFVATRLQ